MEITKQHAGEFTELIVKGTREAVQRLNMGLEDRLDNAIGSLSGGQRQALTLLMATWLKPKLLLLDEHTAALDPKSADQVIKLSEEVIGREKLTTLMVTHSMQQAASLGDRLIMAKAASDTSELVLTATATTSMPAFSPSRTSFSLFTTMFTSAGTKSVPTLRAEGMHSRSNLNI